MREIRPSGSEGGVASNTPSLPLFSFVSLRDKAWGASPKKLALDGELMQTCDVERSQSGAGQCPNNLRLRATRIEVSMQKWSCGSLLLFGNARGRHELHEAGLAKIIFSA